MNKLFKKPLVLMALFIILVGCSTGCSKMPIDFTTTIQDFLLSVDAKVVEWHDNGWLPPIAWEEYQKYKALGIEKFDEYKSDLIAWILKYLSGHFALPTAERPANYIERPDGSKILDAAERLLEQGSITEDQYKSLKAANGG